MTIPWLSLPELHKNVHFSLFLSIIHNLFSEEKFVPVFSVAFMLLYIGVSIYCYQSYLD